MAIAELTTKTCVSCKDNAEGRSPVVSPQPHYHEPGQRRRRRPFRLSWPVSNDRRRSMVVEKPLYRPLRVRYISKTFANASSWDVRLHNYLNVAGYPRPSLQIPMVWNPSEQVLGTKDLFTYFHTFASQSLTTLSHDPKALGKVLMRMAHTGSTPSASAVLNGLLALSSLHRNGVVTQAFRLKIATIKSLAAASTTTLTAREIIQHAAAGMLLCSFEVHQASCTSSQWTWYISGVKQVLNAPSLKRLSRDTELNILMDWVYYHDVISRFTLRHWRGAILEIPPNPSSPFSTEVYAPVRTTAATSHSNPTGLLQVSDSSMIKNLELLSEITEKLIPKPRNSMSATQLEDYKDYLRILDWRIRNIPTLPTNPSESSQLAVVELFKLATLVYLNRVSGDLLEQSQNIEIYLHRAFAMFSQMESCERQYPLLILGCEARKDSQRVVVLELIERTERRESSRSMNHTRLLLQALWTQDDLASKELDYWEKLSTVISTCTITPSFV